MRVAELVFPLAGASLRADYAVPLWQALRERLPWLDEEAAAAILPIKGTTPSPDGLLLGQRAQLALRLPEARLEAAAAIAGSILDLGTELRLGEPTRRELRPTSAQYSPMVAMVAAAADDEAGFLAAAERELAALAIAASLVCGKSQTRRGEQGELRGFSLMLHGLAPDQALRLQSLGLGQGRKLGCGIFVAHKTAVAVGAI